ncbi:hypothetical protein BDN67DRAFT_992727 [Paxillus ammoniavirescens]|nr:hypothetical protein BDN67DRAFT_992727 [Paxillus ammoniavirescens]
MHSLVCALCTTVYIVQCNTQRTQSKSNPPATTERKFLKKVEVVADPGCFEGDRARFSKWWTKVQIWISSNLDGLDTNKEVCSAVWSRMKGPITGRYAETRMIECLNNNNWVSWNDLKIEIARNQIQNLKQGNSHIDDFITCFLSLSCMANISDEHSVYL